MRSSVAAGGTWWVGIGIAASVGIVVAGVAGRPWVGLGVLMTGLATGAIGHRANETRTPTAEGVIRADGGATDIEMVVAIIRPGKLNDVKRALAEAGAASLTVTNVSGRGTQPTETGQWRGEQYIVDLHQKVKVECAVPDTETDVVVDAIQEAAQTGEPGDGKIFVVPVLDACRVSTNERGLEAM